MRRVALLAEGVDRNLDKATELERDNVALLAEGVDRNIASRGIGRAATLSPSSRRAWIEIPPFYPFFTKNHVALLAEGVDRNFGGILVQNATTRVALLAEGVDRNKKFMGEAEDAPWSPSSRRAWIEI